MSLGITGLTEVLDKGLCTFCGACLGSCPRSVLVPVDETFILRAYKYTTRARCLLCGICYHQCPITGFPVNEIERKVFGRERKEDEELGVHRGYYVTRSTKSEILDVAQDGGAVTSILAYALKSKKIDCAIVTGLREDTPWKPWPIVATTYDGLLRSAGSKYTPSPILYGLMPAVERYRKYKVAVVGTPCQVWAVRKMQTSPHRLFNSKLADAIKLTIGIFCLEAYCYDELFSYIRQQGIDPMTISRFEIKRGRFIAYVEGKEAIKTRVKKLKTITKECCHHCTDYAAELADISVGGVGCSPGWSMVVIRSEKGEEFFKGARKAGFLEHRKASEADPEVAENLKLARFKRGKASVPHIP